MSLQITILAYLNCKSTEWNNLHQCFRQKEIRKLLNNALVILEIWVQFKFMLTCKLKTIFSLITILLVLKFKTINSKWKPMRVSKVFLVLPKTILILNIILRRRILKLCLISLLVLLKIKYDLRNVISDRIYINIIKF